MDPGRALVRGLKIGTSNPELAVISFGASLATGVALVVPAAAALAGLGVVVAARIPPDATGEEVFLYAATFLLDHWGVTLSAYAAAVLWAGLILFLYLYAQAGVVGCVARSHRGAPPGDRALKPAFGASPAFKAFSARAYWDEVRSQGWRVTLVATAYSLVALLPLLAYGAWLYGCFRIATYGEARLGPAIAGAVLGLAPTMLVLWGLAVHYRFAVVCAVLRRCGWREAVTAANAVFGARPLAALVVVGAAIAARYLLGAVALLLGLPFLALSLLPAVGLLFLVPRVIVSLVQGLLSAGITVAALGATAEVCEPVEVD
jgi:hypothetical protein